jgi:hypothetical protein
MMISSCWMGGDHVAVDPAELATEQEYFDRAAAELDRFVASLATAPMAAGNTKAGRSLRLEAEGARNLLDSQDPVAFGRFVDGDGTWYIGKRSVNDEEKEILVVNWQSPAARPFYQATVAEPGDVLSKRTYDAPHNRIKDWQDISFALVAEQLRALADEEFIGQDDAVLLSLDRTRDNEMRDIVATIQASQDGIVRSAIDQLLIVEGGPGTGKTAVALHRVSWILFNHPEITPGDVLVVGPNPTFGRYIRKVLPDLGDHDVVHRDLTALGPVPSSGAKDDDHIARIKGDARMPGLLARALRARIRVPEERLSSSEFELQQEAASTAVRRGLTAMERSSYSVGRQEARRVIASAIRRPGGGATDSTSAVEQALERIWPGLSPAQFLRELLGSRERLLEAAGTDFTAAEVSALYRQSADKVGQEPWTDADVALLDEAQALLTGQPSTYRHIVVDEAQDLTPMQLRSLRRLSGTGSMTLVGDLAQSTGPGARDSWDDVLSGLQAGTPSQVAQLDIGYRVPREVMKLAEQLLPQIAPGLTAPRVVREVGEGPDLQVHEPDDFALPAVVAAQGHASRGLFVGVVVPDSHRSDLIATLVRREVSWSDGSSGSLGQGGINVVDPVTAKGLEFEAVVVVSPGDIAQLPNGLRLLYIALTRTTKRLTVISDLDHLPGLPAVQLALGATDQTVPVAATPDTPLVSAKDPASDEGPAAQTPVAPPGRREPVAASGAQRAPRGGLEETVVGASVEELSRQLLDAVPLHLHAAVLDGVRERLGISPEDFLDFLA